jgi:hypothetical protein
MPRRTTPGRLRFRVWITRYDDWHPRSLLDRPPRATALEPAEAGTMSGRQAGAYAEAFNRAALAAGHRLWAVAVPVAIRYEGEPRAGELLCAEADLVGAQRDPSLRSG